MTRDAKKQVKGWVSSEVSKVYGVSKSDIDNKKVAAVRAKGRILDSLMFEYKGRPLTPTHFGMTPTTPDAEGYTLRATVIRGQPKTMGRVKKLTQKQRKKIGRNLRKPGFQVSGKSPVMLLPAGKASSTYIPFQRQSANRKDIEAIKTVSLPQMVSGRAEDQIQATMRRELSDRVEFYMKKYMK